MNPLDLLAISISDENVFFAEEKIAMMTYKMMVSGKMDEQDISGEIYCSTVYLHIAAKGWQSILHTEAKAA